MVYDEIFCDEGQDLTEIEFKTLVSLCRKPSVGSKEGLQLAFAGDPLQTINPTGFRWSIIGNDVYSVQGKPVKLQQLQENFRSDKRIVDFANRIQKIRAYYMEQTAVEQQAFEKDGEMPQIIVAETADEISLIQEKLKDLPPESAVIIWPDDNEEVLNIQKSEQMLKSIDHNLNLYSISEAKGLEFRLVVLYKLGSSQEAQTWKRYVAERRKISLEDEIPLLYFLNRLYVAVTRAKSFLVVVDTKPGVDDFWSTWKNAVYLMPRAEIRNLLEASPAFQGEVGNEGWRQWADSLFERAERTRDIRLYERARRAYEKANETQNVSRVDARLLEINEKWQDAGKVYFDIHEFEKARQCFEKADSWIDAYKACMMLPTTPEIQRYIAVYKFEIGRREKSERAYIEFYNYILTLTDDSLEREYMEELGNVLLRMGDNVRAANVYSIIAKIFGDKTALERAANSFFEASNYEYAEKLFAESGQTKIPAYYMSHAENLLNKGDVAEAAKAFFESGATKRVTEIYEQIEQGKIKSPKEQIMDLAADSYFNLKHYNKALPLYRQLLSDPGKPKSARIIGQMGECLERLGDRFGAYEQYREAHLYKKAADLGVELGAPDEEIIRLRIREAIEEKDFEKATKLALNSDDEKLVYISAGQYYYHKGDFVKAVPEFIKAEMWKETLDSLINAHTQAGGAYREEFAQQCDFLVAIAKTEEAPDGEIKDQIMRIVAEVEDDPGWERRVPPLEMGKVYEKCAHFTEAARYYKSRTEVWAKERWLRVKQNQLDSFRAKRELEKVAQIEREIFLSRFENGGSGLSDFFKEHVELLRETDKAKYNQELNNYEKNAKYVDAVANYLQKYVPANLKLVRRPFNVELPHQFSLLLVKSESQPTMSDNVPSYDLKDVNTAIEVRGHGWVEKTDDLEDAIRSKKSVFDDLKAKGVRCIYLTLEERRKVKEGTNYYALSKKYLSQDYFSLRDSGAEKSLNIDEWENFVRAITQS